MYSRILSGKTKPRLESFKALAKRVWFCLSFLRLLPHVVWHLLMRRSNALNGDIARWRRILFGHKAEQGYILAFAKLMTFYPEFRNVFFYRACCASRILVPLCKPMSKLHMLTKDIGPGLYIQHGFATSNSVKSVGKDCWINQQVTIGYFNSSDAPVLADEVTDHAGAKFIGAVSIGSRSIIGANAVVT